MLGAYWFWLAAVSVACFLLERLRPWRPQKAFRPQFTQDLFWLVFNGHFLGLALGLVGGRAAHAANAALGGLGLPAPGLIAFLAGAPFAVQFVVLLVYKDFLEYCVHNLLHRVPWLWEFHKVHHSVEILDWIGNFRFHWMEPIVYKSLTYFPLAAVGLASPDLVANVILPVEVVTLAVSHLNHSNLAISWGPLRYVINSPKMHVWHHDVIPRGGYGKNFGIVLSVWDWIFRTAYMPEGLPERLGFAGMKTFPRSLTGRLIHPLRLAGRTERPGPG